MSVWYACLRSPRSPDVAVAVAKDFSPRLQRYGNDCVVLDVGGLERLLGEPQAIGEELASRITDLSHGPRLAPISDPDLLRSARVAVASSQIGAMLLSSAYHGLTVVTGDVAAALAPVRLEVLQRVSAEIHRLPMSNDNDPRRSVRSASREKDQRSSFDKAFEILQRWGLTTLGECAALPAGALSARLGQLGIVFQRLAQGIDARPLVPDPDVPRFRERVELEWPIDGLEPLAFVLARLLEPLSSALERADRGAAAIHLDLRLVDRTQHTRVLQLPAAMRDAKVLRTLLVLDLESHPPQAAIDIVTIEVDPAPGRVLQYSLLERARPSAETLATLTARLGALVGESRCGQPVLLDSHGPDAFAMRRFAPDESVAATSPVAASVVGSGFSRTRTSPADQPPLKLRRSAGASAKAEAGPCDSAVLRRFRPPLAIRVAVERGRPRHVAIDRRGMPGGHVEQCAGPWRSSGAWWKAPWTDPDKDMRNERACAMSEGPSRPWNRDEWDVALSDGSVCRLFQVRDTGQWFFDGVID
jgi:protein ImuB